MLYRFKMAAKLFRIILILAKIWKKHFSKDFSMKFV